MIAVKQITDLHQMTVEQWHQHEIANAYDGLLHVVCEQHKFNFLLWHEEDVARSPDVSDTRIAQVKRAIDRYNQQRNDWIEKIDDFLLQELQRLGIATEPDARHNSETPGSAIDRLSILALRIYHMQEQAHRRDAGEEHRQKAKGRLQILYIQHRDLAHALQELLDDIGAGRKQLKLYRQFKMYNDPTLNPYLYQQRKQAG
jgi:hypothetical protein